MPTAACTVCMNEVAVPADWKPGQEIQCPCCYVSFIPDKGLNLSEVHESIEACCRTESECGTCDKNHCLIGFAKKAAAESITHGSVRIPKGEELIPKDDLKFFDPHDLKDSLVEILLSCQSCKEHHHPDCIVNIVRNCVETALIGQSIDYKGSTFAYLMDIAKVSPQIGVEINERYRSKKAS